METVLTFDVGGTSIRAGLYDMQARPLAQASQPSPPAEVAGDAAEIPPELWWQGICESAQTLFLKKKLDIKRIRGICISGITRTQIFIAEDGTPCRPAILWQDGRSIVQADMLKKIWASPHLSQPVDDRCPINAYHPLSRILWVKNHEPNAYNKTRWVLQPKDYLNFKLTGVVAGDLISSDNLLNTQRSRAPAPLFSALGLDPKLIPPCFPPEKVVGKVMAHLPAPFDRMAGVPVIAGAMDGWCTALGIGANRPGYAYDIAGTTEVVGLIGRSAPAIPGLVTLPWGDDLFQIGGPTQAGGDCLSWFSEAFLPSWNREPIHLDDLMKSIEKGSIKPSPLIFLPYLKGERTPIWNPAARGVFFGIDRAHTASDFLGAVMQGVAFAVRHILELASGGATEKIKEIRIAGGGATLDIWCRIKSDVTGCEVVRTSQKEAGLFGAALLALQGLGLYADRQTMQIECVKEEKRFYPDNGNSGDYRRLYGIYRALAEDLTPRFEALAAVRNTGTPDPGDTMGQNR